MGWGAVTRKAVTEQTTWFLDIFFSFLCSGPKLLEAFCMSTCVTLSRKQGLERLMPLIPAVPLLLGWSSCSWSVCQASSKTGFIYFWIIGRNCDILIVKNFELLDGPKVTPFPKVQSYSVMQSVSIFISNRNHNVTWMFWGKP